MSLFASIAIAAAAIVAVYAILAQQVSTPTLLKRFQCCVLGSLNTELPSPTAVSRAARLRDRCAFVTRYYVRR